MASVNRLSFTGWINYAFIVACFFNMVAGSGSAQAEVLVRHEFNKGVGKWTANSMVKVIGSSGEGTRLKLEAPDPYLVGPPGRFPPGKPVKLTIRMRSNGEPFGQIYHGLRFTEESSKVFEVNPDGQWHEYVVWLPPLEDRARLRFDPPCGGDTVELAWILVEAGPTKPAEAWARPSELRGKKMIAGGQFTTAGGDRAVTSRFLARNPELTAVLPYDGLIIPAVIDAKWSDKMELPREDRFLHGVVWNATRIPPEAVEAIAVELNSVKWRGITDNFLNFSMIDSTRGRHMPDFANDADWVILEHNARQAARLCRLAGMKGFWLDTEQYGNYRWRTKSGTPEFDASKPGNLKFPLGKDKPEVLRKRGRQWIRAVQGELPKIKIMITFAWSPDANEYEPIRGANAFLDGVLEGIEAPGQLIHGYENTFYFGQAAGTKYTREGFPGGRDRFETARANIRKWRSFSANPGKYDTFLRTGMAAWVEDDPWAVWDGWPSGGPESFWSNLPLALAYSDEYVWVWSEHTRYEHPPKGGINPFLSSLRNSTFNIGNELVAKLDENFQTDPLQSGWHFDFDMMALAGARKAGHHVSLMSLENIPYQWQAGSGTLKVQSLPAGQQRRRFVHPIRMPAKEGRLHSSIDFQAVSLGGDPAQSLQLGLFTADIPSHRDSLSLRIFGDGRAVFVLDRNGFAQEFPTGPPGQLMAGKNYRLAFEKQGSANSVDVSLAEIPGDAAMKCLFQVAIPLTPTASLPEFDELGVALAEGLTPEPAKEAVSRVAPLACLIRRVCFNCPVPKGK